MDLHFHFSTCSVLACCCLWLSNTVTLNDCFPACYPFPNRVCEMCSAKNRRQVPPTATFWCSTSNRVLPSNIKLHSSSPKAFTLFFLLAKWQTASVNQKAVTPAASARQSSLKFPGSILGSQWLASESVQRSVSGVGRAGTARNRKPHFQSFDFFQEIRMKQKAGNSLSFFYFFFLLQSLQEHIKGISSSHHMLYSFII